MRRLEDIESHTHQERSLTEAMTDDRARFTWSAFEPAAIPTKQDLTPLERWLRRFSHARRVHLLDLGCGNGAICRLMSSQGFSVRGIDINGHALARARAVVPTADFLERDVASREGLGLGEGTFDGVVCHLVLSVVGSAAARGQVLRNARAVLRPGGRLFASLSGRSEDVNPEYERLYRQDLPITGEDGTYVSRDRDGKALYWTHHFGRSEAASLFREAGFTGVRLQDRIEPSSRRPDQLGRFYYISCHRP